MSSFCLLNLYLNHSVQLPLTLQNQKPTYQDITNITKAPQTSQISGIPKAPQTSKANRSKYYFSDRKRSPKEVRYMESAFGTQVPLLHCSFLFISLFFPRTICWIIGCKQKCGCCFHRKSVPKLARTPAEDTGALQTNYGRDGGRGEGKDVGEEMASTRGSSAWEASHFGRGPFRRDAKQGSSF